MFTKQVRIDDGDLCIFVVLEIKHRFEEVAKKIDVMFVAEEEFENDVAFGREEIFCHSSLQGNRILIIVYQTLLPAIFLKLTALGPTPFVKAPADSEKIASSKALVYAILLIGSL
jgi:hypothetical protein